jgi:hypothetical protein
MPIRITHCVLAIVVRGTTFGTGKSYFENLFKHAASGQFAQLAMATPKDKICQNPAQNRVSQV